MRVRKNPAPLSGGLFLSNPKKRVARKTRRANAKKKTTMKKKTNRMSVAKRKAAAKKAAATRRRNLLKRKNAAKKAALTRKRNAAMAKRKHTTKRRVNAAKKHTVKRKVNRRPRRYNGAAASSFNIKLLTPVTKLVKKVPVVGNVAASAVGPAVFGMGSAYATHMVLGMVGQYLPAQVQKFGYTIGGVATGALVKVVGKYAKLNKATSDKLALAAIIGGGAIDMYNLLLGGNNMGQAVSLYDFAGGAYDIVPYAGDDHDYEDANMADVFGVMDVYDFSGDEGHALAMGQPFWRRMFPVHRRAAGVKHPLYSRHVGQKFHRFGWLIKLIGPEGAKQLAQLPPQERMKALQAAKEAAAQAAQSEVAGYQAQQIVANENNAVAGLAFDPMAGIAFDPMAGIAFDATAGHNMEGLAFDPMAGIAIVGNM
jgi:hypothetical protein